MGNRRERTHLRQGTWRETTFYFAQCCFFWTLRWSHQPRSKGFAWCLVVYVFNKIVIYDKVLQQVSGVKVTAISFRWLRHVSFISFIFKEGGGGCVILICIRCSGGSSLTSVWTTRWGENQFHPPMNAGSWCITLDKRLSRWTSGRIEIGFAMGEVLEETQSVALEIATFCTRRECRWTSDGALNKRQRFPKLHPTEICGKSTLQQA
jgi:hypothetical protein